MAELDTSRFNISTVDVRVIKGKYVPCFHCHWRSVCVVPKGSMLPKLKEYYGSNDIMYHNAHYAGNIVYRCEEFTTPKR